MKLYNIWYMVCNIWCDIWYDINLKMGLLIKEGWLMLLLYAVNVKLFNKPVGFCFSLKWCSLFNASNGAR